MVYMLAPLILCILSTNVVVKGMDVRGLTRYSVVSGTHCLFSVCLISECHRNNVSQLEI